MFYTCLLVVKHFFFIQYIGFFNFFLLSIYIIFFLAELQSKDVQFIGGEMFFWLCGHVPEEVPRQAGGDMRPSLCWEVPKAFHACWNEICRAQPRHSHTGLTKDLIWINRRCFVCSTQSQMIQRASAKFKCQVFGLLFPNFTGSALVINSWFSTRVRERSHVQIQASKCFGHHVERERER